MAEKLSNVSDMIDVAVKKSRRLKEGILKSEWSKIVGKICKECQPDFIKDGVLHIRVKSPVFVHHFTLEKNRYIKIINEYFDEDIIQDIVIKSGKLDEKREAYLAKVDTDENIPSTTDNNTDVENKNDLSSLTGETLNNRILEKVTALSKMALERENYLLTHGFKKCKVCGMLYEGEELFCKVCIDNGDAKKYIKDNGLSDEEDE